MRLSNMVSSTPRWTQLGVESPLDQPHCGQRVAEALQGVVLRTAPGPAGAGGAQGVDGEHLQEGGGSR